MKVRCKFKCVSKTEIEGNGTSVTLEPVSSGSEENEKFFKYTPSGDINLGILNPAAAEQFEPGKQYYVEFSPAE